MSDASYARGPRQCSYAESGDRCLLRRGHRAAHVMDDGRQVAKTPRDFDIDAEEDAEDEALVDAAASLSGSALPGGVRIEGASIGGATIHTTDGTFDVSTNAAGEATARRIDPADPAPPVVGALRYDTETGELRVATSATGDSALLATTSPFADQRDMVIGPNARPISARGADGGDVIIVGGRASPGGKDGKVVVKGDLHVEGDLVFSSGTPQAPNGTVYSGGTAQAPNGTVEFDAGEPAIKPRIREILRIEPDGTVRFGEPITKEELSDAAKDGSDRLSVYVAILVAEMQRMKDEIERLRSRVE